MAKTAVVYNSRYGTTKKYAKWLAEQVDCVVLDGKKVKASNLEEFDTIIFGCSLYAGGVYGLKFLAKNFNKLKNKKIILYTCGLGDTDIEETIQHINANISRKLSNMQINRIKVFYLRGGINYSKLCFFHKRLMTLLYNQTMKKRDDELSEEDREMIRTFNGVTNYISKESLQPIIDYIGN